MWKQGNSTSTIEKERRRISNGPSKASEPNERKLTESSSVNARGFLPSRLMFDSGKIVTLLDIEAGAIFALRLVVTR